MDRYYIRQDVADYLRISRMTLSRWEKILPLRHDSMGCRLPGLTKRELNEWHEKLRSKHDMKQGHIAWRRERSKT